jgi:pimeloyl-ACP methyl ester carboxylesterase
MATSSQIKADNNTNIRIKTANNSITADNVADQLDASIDYTDQQDALKVDKVIGKSLVNDTEIARLAGITSVAKTQGSIDAVSGSKTTLQYDINTVNKSGGSEVKLPTTTEVGKEILFLASNYSGTVSVYVNDAEEIKLSGGANGVSGNQSNLQINANEAYRFIYRTSNYWYFEKIIDIPSNLYLLASERSTSIVTDGASNFKVPSVKSVKDYVDANIPTTVNTAFTAKTYASTMSVAHNTLSPNFKIDITGNLDLTITGTANGDSGLVNLYFSAAQVATLQGFTDSIITGATGMVPVYFIHDTDGIKWYDGRENQTNAQIVSGINTQLGGTTWQSGGGSTVNSDIYSKELLQISNLNTNSGFVNVDDGIRASGNTSTLGINFTAIDETKPFRIDIIFTVKKASTANFKIKVLKSGIGWQGENMVDVGSSVLTMTKGHLTNQGISAITDNSTWQFSIIGNGTRIVKSVMPVTTKWSGVRATTFQPAFTGQSIVEGFDFNYNPSGAALMFDAIDSISVEGTGTKEMILNSVNIQYYDDLTTYNPKSWVGTVAEVKVLNDNLDNIYPAYVHAPIGAKTLIQYHHPNGIDGNLDSQATFWSDLYNAGYAICYGTFNSYNNPVGTALWGAGSTSSNWGSPAGMVYRKALMDYCDKLIKPDNHIHIGTSMGGYNAMLYAAQYPNKVKGVISICGALDLTTNYANGSFTSLINKAYGAMYRNILSSTGVATSNVTNWVKIADEVNKPALSEYAYNFRDAYSAGYTYVPGDVTFQPYTGVIAGLDSYNIHLVVGSLSKIPLRLIHGDSDATINATQSTAFQTIIENKGGRVDYTSISGGTHLGSTLFNYSTLLRDWLNSLNL